MSLARTPQRPGLARRRRPLGGRRPRLRPAPAALPATLPALLLPRRAARPRRRRPPGQAQRPGAQDHRADRLPGRPDRKPVQHFVGAGAWDDEAVLAELRRHVARGVGRPRRRAGPGPQRLPQEGTGLLRRGAGSGAAGSARSTTARSASSSATSRPPATPCWTGGCTCRRTGPPTATAGAARRQVPDGVAFQESWRIGLDLLDRVPGVAARLGGGRRRVRPGRRTSAGGLRQRRLRYVLDVPCNTLVRDLAERAGRAKPRAAVASGWTRGRPSRPRRWRRLDRSGGEGAAAWCGRWWRRCRPRTRTAASGRASGWW